MNMRKKQLNKAFTLTEILVAMAIILILFAVIVPQFSIIRSNWAGNSAAAEIVQNGRVLNEHIQRYVSAAVKITAISANSVTFEDAAGKSYTYRISGGYVLFGPTGTEAQLAGPVTSFKISGYSLDDLDKAITDVNSVRFVEFQTDFTNATAAGSDKTFQTNVYIQTNGQTTMGRGSGGVSP